MAAADRHNPHGGAIMSIYTDNGYRDRDDYLDTLADEIGIDPAIVREIAAELGPDLDFDDLVSECEDIAFWDGYNGALELDPYQLRDEMRNTL